MTPIAAKAPSRRHTGVRPGRRRLALVGAVAALAVVVVVLVLSARDDATAPITGWTSTEPDVLELHVETGPSDEILGADVEEDSTEVRLRVRIERAASQEQVAVSRTVTVTLEEPLGDRAVLDERGDPVPERP